LVHALAKLNSKQANPGYEDVNIQIVNLAKQKGLEKTLTKHLKDPAFDKATGIYQDLAQAGKDPVAPM
jgi:hypothetical protein